MIISFWKRLHFKNFEFLSEIIQLKLVNVSVTPVVSEVCEMISCEVLFKSKTHVDFTDWTPEVQKNTHVHARTHTQSPTLKNQVKEKNPFLLKGHSEI